ncbi:hypothetical protein [Pantanalinema sp. GBBB05]|uniref:hypothetical protein n=1 Tax=Pantanalinema sp. GBBB05 TaxID=2604139 RepID=UPI001D9035A9|nr:hypothetical protein [Pantanalinema sp. GBBB05]
MPDLIEVMLCCNDEHGNFKHEIDAIQLSDCESGNLEYPDLDSFAMGFRYLEGNQIAVGYTPRPRVLPIAGYRSHVGNLLWDSVKMSPAIAAELFEMARRFGFCMISGETNLFAAWEAGQPITEELILGALEDGW